MSVLMRLAQITCAPRLSNLKFVFVSVFFYISNCAHKKEGNPKQLRKIGISEIKLLNTE